jgi:hypothetical protein
MFPNVPAITVCSRCGAARTEGPACGVCAQAAAVVVAPWPPAELAWARIETRFACAGCAAISPVNHLDTGGVATCASCGWDQPLDPGVWARVLPNAHEIVDLCGVAPWVLATDKLRDARNPHSLVGVTVPARDLVEPGVVAARERLFVRIAPGHPLCDVCATPLDVRPDGAGYTAACARCATVARYALPARTMELCPAARVVVAPENRTDRGRASALQARGGASVLTCPNCTAPLAPGDGVETRCVHCGATSLVSQRLWARLGIAAPRVVGWWVLFQGPSPRRAQMLRSSPADDIQAEIRARALAAMRGR